MLREVSDYALDGPLTVTDIVDGVRCAVSEGGFDKVEEQKNIVLCFQMNNVAGVFKEMVPVFHKACDELLQKEIQLEAGSSAIEQGEVEFELRLLRRMGIALRSCKSLSISERKMVTKDLHRVMCTVEVGIDCIVEKVRALCKCIFKKQ